MTTKATNAGLDARRWHQPKAERDDLPLLDVAHTTIVVVSEASSFIHPPGGADRIGPSTQENQVGVVYAPASTPISFFER